MTLEFIKPKDEVIHPNVLLYGPPKSGKTTGACTAPGGVMLVNADLPNATRHAHRLDTEGRIMEVALKGMGTLLDVHQALASQGQGDARMIDAVVIDPIGELHRRLLEEESKRAIRPTLNQYGDVSVHLERFCRALCELPVAVVFVCHEHPVKDEATGTIDRLPYTGTTNPALGQKLMGMVDIVGYCGVAEADDGTRTYLAQTVNTEGRRGGDRFAVLGDFAPLDLTAWFELIRTEQPHHPEAQKAAA
jgi:hypothetical protein